MIPHTPKALYRSTEPMIAFLIWIAFISCDGLLAQDIPSFNTKDSSYISIKKEMLSVRTSTDSARLYLKLSNYFIDIHPETDSAKYYSKKAFNLSRRNRDIKYMGKAKAYSARAYSASGDYKKATTDINLAINYFKQIEDDDLLYQNMNTLGTIHLKSGNLDLALKSYLSAVDYYKAQDNRKQLTILYNNIGIIYFNLNDLKKARSFFELVIDLCDELGDTRLCENSYQNIANIYGDELKYDKSIHYNQCALEIVSGNNDLVSVERIYSNMAYTYFLMKDFPKSIQYSHKSLEVFSRKHEDLNTIEANTYHTLGLAYLEQNDFKKSREYLTIAHEVGTRLNYISNLPDFEFGLYTYHDRVGDYQKALSYYKDYVDARDLVSGSKIRSNVSEVETAYFTLKKEQAMNALELKKQKEQEKLESRIYLFGLIAGAFGILFLAFVQRQKRVIAENKEQLSKNKYDSLRSQMNPHFIFNTINGVQSQILKSDKLEAYNHLNKFADTIRLMLDNSTRSFIKFEKEVELIKHYVLLESVRFNDKFSFKIDVENYLRELNPRIPAMILQPIVENAIIHGLSNKKEAGHLSIEFRLGGKCVHCTIEDDGIGRREAMKIKSKKIDNHLSIATENTAQRVQLLHKLGYKKSDINYKDLYNTNNNPAGTRVEIILPIKYLK